MSRIVASDNHYEMDSFRFIDYEPGRRDYIGVWVITETKNGRVRNKKFIRLLNVEVLEKKMLRDPKLKDYRYNEFCEQYRVGEEMQDVLIKIARESKSGALALKDVIFECKEYLCRLLHQTQEAQLDATPDDWYWDILPTEIKERVSK